MRRRLNVIASGIALAWMLMAWQPCAFALDPALDVSQYAHTSWKVREGFFKDAVSAIAQTPDGYLWLGTQYGIIRFDGVRAVPWQPSVGQQLPSNYIRSLLAARDGTLWIGTVLGFASWKDGKLTQHPELARQTVGRILEDRDGTVWAGTRFPPPGKLCAYRGDSVQCYGGGGEFGERASSLYEDHAGNLWVGSQTGLWRWNPVPPKLYPLADFESSQGLVELENGVILIAERKSLTQLVDEKVLPYSLPIDGLSFQPSRLLRDRDGSLWIGTFDRGLIHLHQGKVDLFSQFNGLSGNFIRDLFEDHEGNIWVATDNGLDRFHHIAVSTITVNQGLSQSTPWSVLTARDGSVWVGTLNGLNRIRDGQITIYRKRNKSAEPGLNASTVGRKIRESDGLNTVSQSGRLGTVLEITNNGLPDDVIHSLFEDEQQRIWVSTRAGLVYFENDRFFPVRGVPSGVHAIAGDGKGNIWISEDNGLIHLRGGRIVKQFSWTSIRRNVRAIPMLSDSIRGGLWLGFRDGSGIAYFKDGQILASYSTADGLGKGIVGGLQLDADGTLWATTEGGLSRLKDGRVNTLTTKNGLPCDAVHWIIEDDNNSFWLDTACGLARIPRSEMEAWAAAVEKDINTEQKVHAAVFDISDGVRMHASSGGYVPQVGKSLDGKIWFLPWDGVSVIDPRRLPFNPLPPPVHIEQVTADGQTFDASQGLSLPPLVRDVAIDYTALSLVAPEKTRFRYKLEGQDPDWKEVTNERRVQYSNLAPGSYRFRVMAANNNGVWNEEGTFLDFSIAPAFYQTIGFRIVFASLFLAFLFGLHRLRVYRLHRKEKDLRDVVETIPAITWTALPDGRVDFFNRYWQEYTGLSADAAAISDWQTAIHPEDSDQYKEKWRASLETGKPFEDEARFRRTDGQYRWFLTRAVPLRDARGKILKWYGIVTDIEERERLRQLEAELSHINRVSMLGELTASLAHEIQQPIAGAITNANACRRWLTREQPDVEEANAAIKRIERDAKRAADIITRLKSFYKKGVPLQRESVDVNQIIVDMLVLLRNEANRHSIVMRTELSLDLPKVLADRVQLQQVLMNLMLNGIEAMKETGGELAIRSLHEDGQVLIVVSDSGIGLPADKKDQIFNSFFTTKPEGTGMGLSLSRSIIDSYGGHIWASNNNGQGATFCFTLPAEKRQD